MKNPITYLVVGGDEVPITSTFPPHCYEDRSPIYGFVSHRRVDSTEVCSAPVCKAHFRADVDLLESLTARGKSAGCYVCKDTSIPVSFFTFEVLDEHPS